MKVLFGIVAGVAVATVLGFAAPTETEARTAAEKWLALVDNASYSESWTEAASAFKSKVPQEKWVEMVKDVRGPLGPLKGTRSLSRLDITKKLPGVPDGDYAVLQYRSSFKNKEEAVETLTLTLEDGKMKAVGYFLK